MRNQLAASELQTACKKQTVTNTLKETLMKVKFDLTIIALPLIMFFLGCSGQNCPEGLNLKPMFDSVQKCKQQIDYDNDFLHYCDKQFNNRNEACEYHIQRGWDYFYANILDTSMMRFNQAWLLDSTNAKIYWGFGNLLGKQKKFKESLVFFDKSIKLNPNNAKVYQCAATSVGNLFVQSNDVKQLNIAIAYLMKSIRIDSTKENATAFGQLAASYSYFMQKDSARKYLELTDKLDPSAVNPEVRQLLK